MSVDIRNKNKTKVMNKIVPALFLEKLNFAVFCVKNWKETFLLEIL